MKNVYRNPILYYVLVPALTGLWPLLVSTVYLPGAEHNWELEKNEYGKGEKVIAEIIALDPDRLEFSDSSEKSAEFDYAIAIERIAALCRIPTANYKLSSGIIITTKKQKSRRADVSLKDVEITKIAKFLSMIQLRYSNLQCTQITKLQKKKGLPDKWDVDLDLKYYF
ncbi:MAG: hypothetical protein JXB29_07830 [Sedimentisphaerales bacterium]|nr:hypothetical protein [Sedimentisphaerales bacterium]